MTLPGAHPPNIKHFLDLLKKPGELTSVAVVGLFLLASFYTLYLAKTFFIPVVVAILFAFLLKPLVRGLRRFGIGEGMGATLVLAFVIGSMVWLSYRLSDPATEWMSKAPESLTKLEQRLHNWRRPVEKMNQAAEQVAKLASMEGEHKTPMVEVRRSPLLNDLFWGVQNFAASAVVMFILLYFLLASGDLFLRKLIKVLSRTQNKRRAVVIAREMELNISTYLYTITFINSGLGVCVGLAMYFIGMPNPLLWGVMAALLTYVPYFGAMVGIVVVTLVAGLAFDDVWHILLVPATYFVLYVLEGNFVTPFILGRRLTVNPVVIILWLVFWGWMWGIVGAMLAVPLLVTFKIFCDHVEPLAPIGEFLGR